MTTNNSNSILDRVLTSKEEREVAEFQPAEVLNVLFKRLSNKEAEVLVRRFGLQGKKRETLEDIGNSFQVTRERIRQIESAAVKKLQQADGFTDAVEPVDHILFVTLTKYGGIMTEAMLLSTILPTEKQTDMNRSAMLFIMGELLKDKYARVPENKEFRSGWRLNATNIDWVRDSVEAMSATMEEAGEPSTFDEFTEEFEKSDFYASNKDKMPTEVIDSMIHVSQKLGHNPFDEVGLASWGHIKPRRMNDRIYLVLKKEGKPLHFTEIANHISEVFERKAYPPTVHNELILNNDYVLIGRGIYALKDWGYTEGVVADVIEAVLTGAKEPLSRKNIVEKVLDQRMVKKNTIHLALTDKSKFSRTEDGRYAVIQAKDKDIPTAKTV